MEPASFVYTWDHLMALRTAAIKDPGHVTVKECVFSPDCQDQGGKWGLQEETGAKPTAE